MIAYDWTVKECVNRITNKVTKYADPKVQGHKNNLTAS